MDEEALLDEKLKLERKPLTDKYGPFIIPSDTCLQDARQRLHIALEQTRQLREAFTDRVYGKYRVCLVPPCSTEQILVRILSDPQQASKQLEHQISLVNDEKNTEKKEASKLNAEVLATGTTANVPSAGTGTTTENQQPTATTATSTTTSTPPTPPTPINPLEIMNAENAEQLMYISAGLSLIVLPEQDTTGLDISRYTDRSPVHPVTGQRVKGISAAAAAAGEVMLDRARKASAMRDERIRRKAAGMDYQNFSRLEFLANNPIAPPIISTPSAGPETTVKQTSPSITVRDKGSDTTASTSNLKKSHPISATSPIPQEASVTNTVTDPGVSNPMSGTVSGVKRPIPKQSPHQPAASTIPSAAAKAIRARVQANMSVQTLLSLSPSGEELRTDGKLSAATLALMEQGVGTQGTHTKGNQQQRCRHPFPESQGGRPRASQTRLSESTAQAPFMDLSLPPLPTAKERRTRKRLSNILTDPPRNKCRSAQDAIYSVLSRLVEPLLSEATNCGGRPRKVRRVSEITFLHGIHDFAGDTKRDYNHDKAGEHGPTKSVSAQEIKAIDPVLAFQVMQAVGLVQPSSSLDKSSTESVFPDTVDTTLFAVAEKRAIGDEGGVSRRSIGKLRKLHSKFTSNRRTFSDTFTSSLSPNSEIGDCEANKGGQSAKVAQPQIPVVELRGGGEAMHDNSDGGSKGSKAPLENSHSQDSTPKQVADNIDSTGERVPTTAASVPKPNTNAQHNPQAQQHLWNDPSRLVLMNPAYASGHQTPMMTHSNGGTNMTRLAAHLPGIEHYHPNAIQLANQLRLSRMTNPGHHGASELAEYIGGLHPQPSSPYDWSAVGAASAAAAASAQSLAALGISTHRSSLVPFPLQDRARALLRDQTAASAAAHAAVAHRHQTLAYLSAGYPPGASPHFSHMGRSMFNPTTAFMGQGGIVPMTIQPPPPQRTTSEPSVKTDTEPRESTNDTAPDEKKLPPTNPGNKNEKPVEEKSSEQSTSVDATEPQVSSKRKLVVEQVNQEQVEKKIKVESSELSQPKKPEQPIQAGDKTVPSDSVKHEPFQQEVEINVSEPVKLASQSNGTETMSVVAGSSIEQGPSPNESSNESTGQNTNALQFFVPPAPVELRNEIASLVLQAQSHEAVELSNSLDMSAKSCLVAYLIAVGIAVPIPRALVATLLKEKVNSHPSKGAALSTMPQSSRDAAVATILIWMWKHHEQCFQRAFSKSGRIDVEPTCKWLIAAAVERAASALAHAFENPNSRSNSPLANALMAVKNKWLTLPKGNNEKETDRSATTTLDLLIVSTVSRCLSDGFKLNWDIDASLPHFNDLLDYLDESRKCALYSRSQERALLAALIARKATMSLSFSHAYVSSLVRAGEALGHGELFEVVQNEEVNVSTMIPYDVFTDETGAWEDPCRPINGFTPNLTGDDLMRQAHARAMIHKSLKKLQDRHNIKGGTQISGAYTDPPNSGAASDSNKSMANSSSTFTPRGSLKRRSSFAEPPVPPGTGSAVATSWSLYDPRHFSAPLSWTPDAVENMPYGKHNSANRPRSLSLAQFSLALPNRGRGKHSRSVSLASSEHAQDEEGKEHVDEGPLKRSTHEIPWADVAGIFQNVGPGTPKQSDVPATPKARTIFAPFVRQVGIDEVHVDSDGESDEEEDLRDDSILGRHQVVLDRMKEHLSSFLEARQKSQEKRKSRSTKM